jgi:hypothetical protein
LPIALKRLKNLYSGGDISLTEVAIEKIQIYLDPQKVKSLIKIGDNL